MITNPFAVEDVAEHEEFTCRNCKCTGFKLIKPNSTFEFAKDDRCIECPKQVPVLLLWGMCCRRRFRPPRTWRIHLHWADNIRDSRRRILHSRNRGSCCGSNQSRCKLPRQRSCSAAFPKTSMLRPLPRHRERRTGMRIESQR